MHMRQNAARTAGREAKACNANDLTRALALTGAVLVGAAVVLGLGLDPAWAGPGDTIVSKSTSGRNELVIAGNAVLGVTAALQCFKLIFNQLDLKWLGLTAAGGTGFNTIAAWQGWYGS